MFVGKAEQDGSLEIRTKFIRFTSSMGTVREPPEVTLIIFRWVFKK